MKILEITSRYPPAIGGVETDVHATTSLLSSRGHSVEVWTSDLVRTNPLERWRVEFETINRTRVWRMRSFAPLHATGVSYAITPGFFLNRPRQYESFDIVHTHGYAFFANISQCLLRPSRRALPPLILSPHSGTGTGQVRLFYDRVVGTRIVRHLAHVICQTSTERRRFEDLGVPASRISVIPPGPGVPACPIEAIPDVQQQLLGRRYVLSLGRLAPNKGLSVLVKAMVPLLKRDIGLRLVIAGEDHGEARNILSLVHQLRLDGSVILTGRLSDGQANGLLQNCDVFAFPSTGGEAFGISLLSAMQAARAVVATQLPGAMDLIRSGENGVIVRAAEPLALRSAISNLLEDSELALELGNQARDDTALLTWERASLKTAEVLERVAGYSK